MILVSIVACLLGIGLYAFDLTTDIQFSLEMLNETESLPLENQKYTISSQSFPEECKVKIMETSCPEKCWEENHNVPSDPEYINDMKTTGWFAVWHCVQPFVVTFIVFFSMKIKHKDLPDIDDFHRPDCLYDEDGDEYHWCFDYNILKWCCLHPFLLLWFALWYPMRLLGNCLLSLASVLPMPIFTHIYMLYLNVRGHIARSKKKFKEKMENIERNIEEYEALGKP